MIGGGDYIFRESKSIRYVTVILEKEKHIAQYNMNI